MSEPATAVFETIHRALAAEPKTREPMNALVIWTELGKGLAGTLERVGAEKGLLRQVIASYCREKGAADGVDLSRFAYRLEGKERLGKLEAAMAMKRVQAELEEALPELTAEASATDEARKKLFLAVVRGWFPVGLDIMRALPGGREAKEPEQLGALRAWCERYLPVDTSTPADLGVRVSRGV
ncbi:MAG: hypothetical protein ACYC8T_30775 [Myxococcaceae bacterium]